MYMVRVVHAVVGADDASDDDDAVADDDDIHTGKARKKRAPNCSDRSQDTKFRAYTSMYPCHSLPWGVSGADRCIARKVEHVRATSCTSDAHTRPKLLSLCSVRSDSSWCARMISVRRMYAVYGDAACTVLNRGKQGVEMYMAAAVSTMAVSGSWS
jgi:hypothetical protein